MHLRPCPSCARHVRADETACPFCEAALDLDVSPRPSASPRLGRAARIAFGAAVATASLAAACGNSRPPNAGTGDPNAAEAGVGTGTTDPNAAVDAGQPKLPDQNMNKPYGAPPADGLAPEIV